MIISHNIGGITAVSPELLQYIGFFSCFVICAFKEADHFDFYCNMIWILKRQIP